MTTKERRKREDQHYNTEAKRLKWLIIVIVLSNLSWLIRGKFYWNRSLHGVYNHIRSLFFLKRQIVWWQEKKKICFDWNWKLLKNGSLGRSFNTDGRLRNTMRQWHLIMTGFSLHTRAIFRYIQVQQTYFKLEKSNFSQQWAYVWNFNFNNTFSRRCN